jgi:hypothetical protein
MDNEREIKELASTRNFFLRKDLGDLQNGRELYDIEKEFRATKKNRKWWIGLLIAGIVLLLLGASWLVTLGVQNWTKNYDLDLDAFQDVDLSEILDEVKKLETELAAAQKGLAALMAEKQGKERDVNDRAGQDLLLIQTKKYSKKETERRNAAVERERNEKLAAIADTYDPLIDEQRAAVAILEERKQRYDSRQVEMARKQEELLFSQQQVFEAEKKVIIEEYDTKIVAQRSYYEGKLTDLRDFISQYEKNMKELYDPVFSGPQNEKLLKAPISEERRRKNMPQFSPVDYPEELLSTREIARLDGQLREIRDLINLVYTVPYDNSIEVALRQIDYRILILVDSIKSTMDKMVLLKQDLEMMRILNESYIYAFESLIRETGGQGFVLDPRDSQNILVYIEPGIKYENGTEAYVFRYNDQMVAKLAVYHVSENHSRARVLEVTRGFELKPFDQIILNIQSE